MHVAACAVCSRSCRNACQLVLLALLGAAAYELATLQQVVHNLLASARARIVVLCSTPCWVGVLLCVYVLRQF